MKLGLKALVVALVMALAAVPAAFAKGNGHGHGGGKPSWAGSGHAHMKALHGKEAKKEKHKGKHHEVAASEDQGTPSADDVDLEGLNPAWYCKTLRDGTTLADAFAEMFGTNPNGANAFGKCVSQRAHELNGSDAAGGDEEQQDTCDTAEPPATEGTDTVAEGTDTGSGEEAVEPEECESDDSATDEPAEEQDEQAGDDEQGENEQGGDEGDTTDEGSIDLGAVLRFIRV